MSCATAWPASRLHRPRPASRPPSREALSDGPAAGVPGAVRRDAARGRRSAPARAGRCRGALRPHRSNRPRPVVTARRAPGELRAIEGDRVSAAVELSSPRPQWQVEVGLGLPDGLTPVAGPPRRALRLGAGTETVPFEL